MGPTEANAAGVTRAGCSHPNPPVRGDSVNLDTVTSR